MLSRMRRSQVIIAAAQRAARQRIEIGQQIRSARLAAGLSLATVARTVGRSVAWVSRAERGMIAQIAFDALSELAAAVGLRISISAWPDAPAIRDAGQVALLQRFHRRIGDAWSWQIEVVVPIPGDRRAVDAVIATGDGSAAIVEAITQVHDLQAQIRSIRLKARDMRIDRVIVVVRASDRNRRVLRAAADIALLGFPIGTRTALRTLANGRLPAADAMVLV